MCPPHALPRGVVAVISRPRCPGSRVVLLVAPSRPSGQWLRCDVRLRLQLRGSAGLAPASQQLGDARQGYSRAAGASIGRAPVMPPPQLQARDRGGGRRVEMVGRVVEPTRSQTGSVARRRSADPRRRRRRATLARGSARAVGQPLEPRRPAVQHRHAGRRAARPRPRRASPAPRSPGAPPSRPSSQRRISARVTASRLPKGSSSRIEPAVHQQRAGQRDALAHPPGELRGQRVERVAQAELAEQARGARLERAAARGLAAGAAVSGRERPCARRTRRCASARLPRQQQVLLEHVGRVAGAAPAPVRRQSPAADATAAPSTHTAPAAGGSTPASTCSSVLLPQPLRPTTARHSPAGSSKSMPASTAPARRPAAGARSARCRSRRRGRSTP